MTATQALAHARVAHGQHIKQHEWAQAWKIDGVLYEPQSRLVYKAAGCALMALSAMLVIAIFVAAGVALV